MALRPLPSSTSVIEQQGRNLDGSPRFVLNKIWLAWLRSLNSTTFAPPATDGIVVWDSSALESSAVLMNATGNGLTITNANGTGGNPTFALSASLQALYNVTTTELTGFASLTTNGLVTRTSSGNYTGRTITAGTKMQVTNGDGVAGNPTVTFNGTDLTANPIFYGSDSSKTIATATITTLTTATVTTNIGSGLATSGVFTVPTSGTYKFTGMVGFSTSTTAGDGITIYLYKNGNQIGVAPTVSVPVNGYNTNVYIDQNHTVAATDTITLRCQHNHGSDLTTTLQYFTGVLLSV